MCNKIVFDKKEYFWKKKTNIDNNNSILGVRITTPPPRHLFCWTKQMSQRFVPHQTIKGIAKSTFPICYMHILYVILFIYSQNYPSLETKFYKILKFNTLVN